MKVSRIVVAAFVLCACGADSSLSPSNLAGTWVLSSVNDEPLPFLEVVTDAGEQLYVVADTLTLTADAAFTEHGTFRDSVPGNAAILTPFAYPGTYIVNGVAAAFVFAGGASGTGEVGPTQITVDFPPGTFVFNRL